MKQSRAFSLPSPALTSLGNPSIYPAWRVANLKFCTEKSLPPLAGDGAPMKKMPAFFSWVPGKVAEGRKGDKKPGFIPLGEPSIYGA